MVAVSTSSPPTATSPSNYQDPLPNPASRPSDDAPRSPIRIPNLDLAGGPRLRDGPVAPVRVNFQQENFAQPSNADIEHTQGRAAQVELADRTLHPLPSPPEAAPPPPPPHGSNMEPASPQELYDDVQGTPRANGSAIPALDTSFAHQSLPSMPSPTKGFAAESNAYAAAPNRYGSNKISPTDRVRNQDQFRNSRESDETASTNPQQTSMESSATTSASSLSGINENAECQTIGDSPESSVIEGNIPGNQSVPLFQYHHHKDFPPRVSSVPNDDSRSSSTPDLAESASNIGRHLTPNSNNLRRTSMPRPQSSYSIYSDLGARGRSPGLMPGGAQSRKSPDVRMSTYAELLNAPYPQQAPAPLTPDNSNLRTVIGNNASLLSSQKTLDMYRANVKKTSDLSIQYSFAIFLISTAQEQGLDVSDPKMRKNSPKPQKGRDSPAAEGSVSNPYELVREARQILQRLASAGYPFAQYYLADGYASGLFNKGKEDYNSAFPLFVLAAKHGHAESGYRTALCYEFGWGCRKDPAKAVQFLRTAASKRHPGAMTRLGKACLSGDLGEKRYREGIKWMKLAAEAADTQYNSAPYQLGCLYENGYGADIFKDDNHAAELFTQAADLGHPEANYRLGDAYEHGLLNCPRDPALSVHFYTGAAERGHAGAMMGLCAWYMVGAPPILEKDEEEAYEWARRSADLGFVKAQYAVGYFTEMGIGCRRDVLEANVWYVKAADAGDERAKQRLAIIQAAVSGQGTPMEVAPPRNGKIQKGTKDDKECVVM
ncbi:protoplast regeneration and killer toxin resistance [Fusarium albosuccineum]|uniref:Protoplast regeneration and killer toxin resistance n=1 Tax=Fusarium albosuccineum TaxID=1237068 RepID=A0A8H4P2Y5_9HYPO|nr:protoplast regeneration and killer toxin resistance [Fusarium albosuccineum]